MMVDDDDGCGGGDVVMMMLPMPLTDESPSLLKFFVHFQFELILDSG